MSEKEMVIKDNANCPFLFRHEPDVKWRCQVRYFFAKTSPTKDGCLKKLCPLRRGKVIAIAKQPEFDKYWEV